MAADVKAMYATGCVACHGPKAEGADEQRVVLAHSLGQWLEPVRC